MNPDYRRGMKKILTALITIILAISTFSPAKAVENGDDATGNGFVVPIKIDKGAGVVGGCSGALISSSIVVTAGHCVLDANGLVTQNIYVGLAGSSMDSINTGDKVSTIQITSSFKTGANNAVGDDDLAFLTLSKPQTLRTPIFLASEKQVTDLKSTGGVLKSFGYGYYGATLNTAPTFPKSFEGTFSAANLIYVNSAYMISTKADACKGDSGSPILSISATQVTLVGITTGGVYNGNCTQKWTDGNYYTNFTLIGRYANLAFSAATDVMNSQEQTLSTQKIQLADKDSQIAQAITSINNTRSQLSTAQSAYDAATQNLDDLQAQLDEANATIVALNKKLPQTIVCIKGKVTQKVTAVMPKCPKGFVLKP